MDAREVQVYIPEYPVGDPGAILNGAINEPLKLKEDYKGKFLGFSTDFEELENGVGNYPVALVETDGGEIRVHPVALVKFLAPAEENLDERQCSECGRENIERPMRLKETGKIICQRCFQKMRHEKL